MSWLLSFPALYLIRLDFYAMIHVHWTSYCASTASVLIWPRRFKRWLHHLSTVRSRQIYTLSAAKWVTWRIKFIDPEKKILSTYYVPGTVRYVQHKANAMHISYLVQSNYSMSACHYWAYHLFENICPYIRPHSRCWESRGKWGKSFSSFA